MGRAQNGAGGDHPCEQPPNNAILETISKSDMLLLILTSLSAATAAGHHVSLPVRAGRSDAQLLGRGAQEAAHLFGDRAAAGGDAAERGEAGQEGVRRGDDDVRMFRAKTEMSVNAGS